MSLLTLPPGETSINRIVTIVRQLIQYVQSAPWTAGDTGGTVTSVATAGLASGGPITTSGTITVTVTTLTNSLGADVALNNTANYFDGPSVAQGTSGTWYASGTVTLIDTAGPAHISCKLWDGTTLISSIELTTSGANFTETTTLSGILASPGANIRISCKDASSTAGKITFNQSGNSKDSTLTVLRVA